MVRAGLDKNLSARKIKRKINEISSLPSLEELIKAGRVLRLINTDNV